MIIQNTEKHRFIWQFQKYCLPLQMDGANADLELINEDVSKTITTEIMCTFNLTMSDTLIEAVRPTFKTKEAIASWLQQQATFWLQSIVDEQSADSLQPSLTKTDYDMSVFDCFSGDFGGDRDANEIADELHDSRVFARKTPIL